MQKMYQSFWKRYNINIEYLNQLQQCTKRTSVKEEPQINDLVIIQALGGIIDLHQGADNLTRIVTIKTKQNTLKRPIHKICKLLSESAITNDSAKQTDGEKQTTNYTIVKHKKPQIGIIVLLLMSIILGRNQTPVSDEAIKITKFGNKPAIYIEDVGKIHLINDTTTITRLINLVLNSKKNTIYLKTY